jgi:hypothetical protein
LRAESQIILTYGEPKIGKTTDLGYTFPQGHFFAPSASSLLPLRRIVGIAPKTAVVKDLTAVSQYVRAHATDESISAIVIDDIALLADEAINLWTANNPDKRNGWYPYQMIKQTCQELCVIARHAPWHLVLDSHERKPEVDENGIRTRGGPILPGKLAGPALEKNSSLILRAIVSDPLVDKGASDDAWPVIYTCDVSDRNFTTGDRNGLALKKNPLNLREILFAGGVELPYATEWQAEEVAKLTALALEGKLNSDALTGWQAALGEKATPALVDWILRDARARVFMLKNATSRSDAVRSALLKGV